MIGGAINTPILPKTASPAPPLDPAVLQLKVPKYFVGMHKFIPAIVSECSAEEDRPSVSFETNGKSVFQPTTAYVYCIVLK